MIKICFLGDISLSGEMFNGTQNVIDTTIKELIYKADLVIGNFESVIGDEEEVGLFLSRCDAAEILKRNGIDIVTIANNHIYDYGLLGLKKTIKKLQEQGITVLGLKNKKQTNISFFTKTVNDISIGILSAGYTKIKQDSIKEGEAFWEFNRKEIITAVQMFKDKVDCLIVNIHKGKMFNDYPSPKDKSFSFLIRNLGADIVIMHHAHVFQGVSEERNGVVAYNLGNFLFDSTEGNVISKFSWFEQNSGGILEVELSSNKIEKTRIHPIVIDNHRFTRLANEKEAEKIQKHILLLSKNTDSWKYFILFYFHWIRVLLFHQVRVLFFHFAKKYNRKK